MNLIDDESTFTVSLTLRAHQAAAQFREQQSHPQKAKQVYLNALAVQAVSSYLGWLGIETDLAASSSWNPVFQSLADVADLHILGQGKLECRPVLPNAQTCYVPPEVWVDRLGYVAVQFDAELTEATLLGFLPEVTNEWVALVELQALDALLDRLSSSEAVQFEATQSAAVQTAGLPTASPASSRWVNLSQWFTDQVAEGWQTVEALLGNQTPAFSFRGHPLSSAEELQPSTIVQRGKMITLGSYVSGEQVALLVGLLPLGDREMDIWVQVCPMGTQMLLPTELELSILDEAGTAVMQAQARSTEMMQLRFSGQPGERFSIRMLLGDTEVVEGFVV